MEGLRSKAPVEMASTNSRLTPGHRHPLRSLQLRLISPACRSQQTNPRRCARPRPPGLYCTSMGRLRISLTGCRAGSSAVASGPV